MGIDIYMNWKGMTDADHKQQITGFSITAGEAGYLREAYHGGPYVTRWLVQEAFDETRYEQLSEAERENYRGIPIPAATLRARLPAAVFLALARHAIIYDEPFIPGDDRIPRVLAGAPDEHDADPEAMLKSAAVHNALISVFADIAKMRSGTLELDLASGLNEEQVRAMCELIRSRNLPDYALAFVDFCILAETKQQETGEPVLVYASY